MSVEEERPRGKGEKWFAGFVGVLWVFGVGMKMGEDVSGVAIYILLSVFVLALAQIVYSWGAEREWRRSRRDAA